MAIDPLALINAQRSQVQQMHPGTVHRGLVWDNGNGPQTYNLPHGPGEPGYQSRIQPPENLGNTSSPDPASEELDAQVAAVLASGGGTPVVAPGSVPPARRLAVTFGRGEGQYVISVEEAPTWDSHRSYKVSAAGLAELLPILRELVPLKDMTGGDLVMLEQDYAQNAQPPAPAAPLPRVSGHGAEPPARPPQARPKHGGATARAANGTFRAGDPAPGPGERGGDGQGDAAHL